MEREADIDRLYGLPLDEFVDQRDALAKRLRSAGEREEADRIKALRKPTAGAWALNQAVRRRRAETAQLLEAGERLREAHDALISGGDRAALRSAMEEERSVVAGLADCAEVIASETGKSGPALRERVRSTLHAAALDEDVREELAAGRLVREQEVVGLGDLGSTPVPPTGRRDRSAPPSGRRGRSASPAARRGSSAPSTDGSAAAPTKAEQAAEARARERAERLTAAEESLGEAAAELARARSAREDAGAGVEDARAAVTEAEAAERAARKLLREREREHAKRQREVDRLRR